MVLNEKLKICLVTAIAVSFILSLLFSSGFLHRQSLHSSDLFYSEGKPFSEIVIIAIDDKSIQEIGRWPWNREVFANAIEKTKEAKVIGVDVSFFESASGDEKLKSSLKENVILVSECNKFSGGQCANWLMPIFNAAIATANIYSEDEIARAVPFMIDGKKSFSVIIAEKYLNTELSPQNKILINYAKADSFKTAPFSDLINDKANISFKDKIVLIGATAKDLHDEKLTPISSKPVPGVEIHANAIQTILQNKSLKYQAAYSVILTILLFSLIIALMLYFFRLVYAIAALAIIPFLYLFAGMRIFVFQADNFSFNRNDFPGPDSGNRQGQRIIQITVWKVV